MRFFVPIDKSSVRKNEYAGTTVYQQFLGYETTVEYFLRQKDNIYKKSEYIINSCLRGDEILNQIRQGYYKPHSVSEVKLPGEEGEEKISINTNYRYQTLHSISPEPDYYYSYENINVVCEECNQISKLKDLDFDSVDDYSSDTICPKCNHWGCCELEYERFDKKKHVQ